MMSYAEYMRTAQAQKAYVHCFYRGSDGRWAHEISVDTRGEARVELDALRNEFGRGRVLSIKSAHDPLYLVAALNGE